MGPSEIFKAKRVEVQVHEILAEDVPSTKIPMTHYYVDIEGEMNLEDAPHHEVEEAAATYRKPLTEFFRLPKIEIQKEKVRREPYVDYSKFVQLTSQNYIN